MNSLSRVSFLSLFFFVHTINSSQPRYRSKSEGWVDTNTILKKCNRDLFMKYKPKLGPKLVVENVINSTPYLMTIDDEHKFKLVAIINPNSTSSIVNHELESKEFFFDANKEASSKEACLSIRLYNEKGEHIAEKDTQLTILQPHNENQYVTAENFIRDIQFVVAHKMKESRSLWQLQKCYTCNVKEAQINCIRCDESLQQARRCKSVDLALLLSMRPENFDNGIITAGYKIKMKSDHNTLHHSL
jgi:hypothetical protein